MALHDFEVLRQNVNVGRVRLSPSAISFDPDRRRERHHTWLLTLNTDGTVRIHNGSTGHFKDLGALDVLLAEPDDRAPRDGLNHLRVTLRRGLKLQGNKADWV